MESLADGVPVLGSNIGGIPEMVEDGVNGLLFEPGNSEELARKAQKFFENPEFLENLGIQAREIAREKFSSKNHLEKLISIYKKAKNSA
jgi:glycosyltransferase involved in cell wall biosynthesis